MNEREKIKFERLIDTVRRNFKVTRMYARYLEECPSMITKEMIDVITDESDISVEAAISALLSEAFSLDFDKAEDRRIILDYFAPSIRLLDAEKYENNPYYKNIHLENLTDGEWEIRWEEYNPYQAVICHDMIIEDDFKEIPPLGFFPEGFRFPAILEGGNEWMTLTPVDLDTCEEAIEAAHGKVVTFGLGLGYYAYMASEKEEVDSVTVVELSDDVIRLFRTHILPQMPNKNKIRILNCDAFEYAEKVMPSEHFDVAFVDTWRDAGDGAPMYKRMKLLESLSPDTKFLYWVEGFLRSRVRAEKLSEIINDYDKGTLTLSYDEIEDLLRKI
ncbi:MAG: hypothetical protein IJX58_04280 [Clostridia bacterium]|nr:hypothetical protein [Clostridia bacterium]